MIKAHDIKYEINCKTCDKLELLSYKARWYRLNKGNGNCLCCAAKLRDKKGLELGRGWNKGMIGYGQWSKWNPKGDLNPFYGKKHSDVSRRSMHLSKIGKKRGPMPEEVRAKISLSNKGKPGVVGDKNHNWKGGITLEDKKQRVKFKKTMQKYIFSRDNYTCQICNQYGGKLQVDHIKSWSTCPGLRFEESNCRTLCMACHYYVTFKRKIPDGIIWGHNLGRWVES